jgi:DNA-binding NarL/FixJ family response regulator
MRIILADGDPRTFYALRMLLGCETRLEAVGEVTNTESLLELARDRTPDVVLLDWELPGHPDAALLSDLRDILPQARIIALSGRAESEREALHAGADAFVSKAEPASTLIAEVMRLVDGDRTDGLAGGPAETKQSVAAVRMQAKSTSEERNEKARGSS